MEPNSPALTRLASITEKVQKVVFDGEAEKLHQIPELKKVSVTDKIDMLTGILASFSLKVKNSQGESQQSQDALEGRIQEVEDLRGAFNKFWH